MYTQVPSQTMFSYPKHLIQQAMSLPGVPSKAEIIRTFHTGEAIKLDHSLFDKEKYFAILTQAQAWAQQHLLTKSVGHRVATAIPAIKSWSSGNMPRVLAGVEASLANSSVSGVGAYTQLLSPCVRSFDGA